MRLLFYSPLAIRLSDPPRQYPALIAAINAVLNSRDLEPAFVAQVIALPSESDIAREIARDVDPDAVYGARQALRLAVMTTLSKTLTTTYEGLSSPERYSPDADATGRRARKNTCLDLS